MNKQNLNLEDFCLMNIPTYTNTLLGSVCDRLWQCKTIHIKTQTLCVCVIHVFEWSQVVLGEYTLYVFEEGVNANIKNLKKDIESCW